MRREKIKKYWYYALPCLIIMLGILLRLKGLLINPSFWHDECAVAWNIKFKSYSELFGVLRFLQMAPPFFLIATKLMTKFLGFSEIVFRLIPFIFGCLSIVGFYFLAAKTLKVQSSVFWAVFLFAINQELINYSFEFKPYGVDVFFTIITLLFFINLNLEKLNAKKTLLYGLLLALIPWCSFVSVFIIVGGLLNLAIKNFRTDLKKKIILAIPIILSFLIYLKIYLISNYFGLKSDLQDYSYLLNSQNGSHMVNFWQNYFITLSPKHFLYLLINNIRYFLAPVQYVLFPLILLIWGIIIYAREKSTFFNVTISSFLIFVIASILHIYPFAERLILFFIPIFLLYIIKPLDLASQGELSTNKKIKLFIILILTFFTAYPQISATNDFINAKNINRGEYPKEMLQIIVNQGKPNDKIVITAVSNTEFAYYSSFYNLKNEIIQQPNTEKSQEKYLNFLNTLKPGYYWIYSPFDYATNQVNPWIESWAQTHQVLYKFKDLNSTLMYVYVK